LREAGASADQAVAAAEAALARARARVWEQNHLTVAERVVDAAKAVDVAMAAACEALDGYKRACADVQASSGAGREHRLGRLADVADAPFDGRDLRTALTAPSSWAPARTNIAALEPSARWGVEQIRRRLVD
jgi:hypothetical protein